MSQQSQSRPHAPFGARLLAFVLGVGALFDMLSIWLQRRAFAVAGDADAPWARREQVFAMLEMFHGAGLLLAVLLACLGVFAALRYRRDLGDGLERNLALGAALGLGLDALRQVAQAVITTFSSPASSGSTPAEWNAYLRLWHLSGVVIVVATLVCILLAAGRAERAITGRHPTWALVAGGLLAASTIGYLTLQIGDFPRDPFAGFSLRDLIIWLGLVSSLAIAVGLVMHAAHIRSDDPDPAWTRAADGLGRYKNATALRLLLVFLAGMFLVLGRTGLSPLVLLGILCTIGLVGIVTGLFQIAGLVRTADAPKPPVALAVALPLFGVALFLECVALVPIVSFVFHGGENATHLQHASLPELAALTQALGTVTAITLLLALRALAVARAATAVVRRCSVLIVAMLVLIGVVIAAVSTLPELALRRDSIEILVLASGLTLLITAIWFVVSYFRTLTLLQAAMTAMTRRVADPA